MNTLSQQRDATPHKDIASVGYTKENDVYVDTPSSNTKGEVAPPQNDDLVFAEFLRLCGQFESTVAHQTQMASRLGISRRTVQRSIGRLRTLGKLTVHGGRGSECVYAIPAEHRPTPAVKRFRGLLSHPQRRMVAEPRMLRSRSPKCKYKFKTLRDHCSASEGKARMAKVTDRMKRQTEVCERIERGKTRAFVPSKIETPPTITQQQREMAEFRKSQAEELAAIRSAPGYVPPDNTNAPWMKLAKAAMASDPVRQKSEQDI